ncbi:type I polyketide synthase, partial [Streptomyces sp. NPDC017524]|uniref:type I polyketide synthase n=1 Tax=Streptomyces sp. NPDC017524 TaxID=3364999 RepID=UPI0037A431F4
MSTDSDHGKQSGYPMESIAVVGLGCRFPGGVRSLDAFGRLLTSATDTFSDVPADRWGPEHADRPGEPGGISNGRGAFLDDIDRFDAPYFGISPPEASLLDPQQRLLLEVAWEAMADSGRPREEWRGTRTSVVLGLLARDYELLHTRTLGLNEIGRHHVSGLEPSFAAGRLAYAFDLNGPVNTVNSACSSSLLAVHQACQTLRAGECDTALAGGASLLITPDISVFLSQAGAISPTGRCRPFDAGADGIVRGEGAGVVVLKRLSDALADRDRIYAVIRGSATNNDGTSLGLTVPNSLAQEDLLRTALLRSGLTATDVDYVEAHGTGTAIGDIIEVDAIGKVYGEGRDTRDPLLIGSHKALLGHMDAAAGIGGLLKSVWTVNSGTVARQPYVERLNPRVDWRGGAVTVPTDNTRVDRAERPVRAGVSAFGLSGTNVHVVLEAPPAPGPTPAERPGDHPYTLLASASSAAGLAEQVALLRQSTAGADAPVLADLAASAATRGTHDAYRYAVVVEDRADLPHVLGSPDEPVEGAFSGHVPDPESAPGPVFVFSGHEGRCPGGVMDLYDRDEAVREVLDEVAELIRAETGRSLLDDLRAQERRQAPRTAELLVPAVFAAQVATARWFRARGVTPAAVLGVGPGEVAAAHVAGALSLSDATTVILRLAHALGEAAEGGVRYAVSGTQTAVTEALAATGHQDLVVAVDGPDSLVIAGPHEETEQAVAALRAHGLDCRPLETGVVAYGPLAAGLAPRLEAELALLSPEPATVPMRSTVDPGADSPRVDAAYWARSLSGPVRLGPALDRLLAEEDHPLVEIGPHPVLLPTLTEAQRRHERQAPALAVFDEDTPVRLSAHRALARLHTAGTPVTWTMVTGRPTRFRTLPVPSWGGGRYWLPGVPRGAQGVTDPAGAPTTADARGAIDPTRTPSTGDGRAAPARIRLSLLDEHGQVTSEMYAEPTEGGAPVVTPAPVAAPVAAPAPTPAAASAPVSAVAPADAARLGELVTGIVRELLGLSADQPVARRRGLFEQGLDSATAVGLRTRLESRLGISLPTTVVFEHPTVNGLAELLAGLVPQPQATAEALPALREAPPAPSPTPTSVPAPAPSTPAVPAEDGIAVIGMSCRLPGASTPQEFWELLGDRTATVGEFPAERLRDPIWAELDGLAALPGSYLDDIGSFDAPFFRISPREAKLLDPQQRLFLESAWEALEHAGCPADTLESRPVGVYAGLSMADYQFLVARDMDSESLNLYHGTGTSFAALAGRLSYILGLRGPSMTVDTACSSALTAVHLACQALRSGDCEIAVVGGASAIVAPSPLIASMAASNALSADGQCKAFDESADGFACGEGAVVLVLKPLSAAVRDGDDVQAVLRASTVNQDGATGGLTVPNPVAQVEVVRKAVERAGWAPHEVDYVETHGTGTPLGDPIEVRSLAESLGSGRAPENPLLIGSAKANVGHLGAAAGAVGLLKVILSLRHGSLPPHLVAEPSSRIDWDRLPVALVREPRPWPEHDRPARAGVSAFGFSGSNAHVLVEQYPAAVRPATARSAEPRERVLLVSAATPSALRTVALRMAERLDTAPERLDDLIHTATHRRAWLEHRLAVVGSDAQSLAAALEETAFGEPGPATRSGQAERGAQATVALRYGTEPPARATLERWAATSPAYVLALGEYVRLLGTLTEAPADPYDDTPGPLRAGLTFCHQAAATEALRSFGITVDEAFGEGAGAVAAAWASGRLTSADALRRCLGDVPAAGLPETSDSWCDLTVDVLEENSTPALLAAEVFVAGHRPVVPNEPAGPPVDLPGYPWEHQHYWYRDFPAPQATVWPLSADSREGLAARAAELASFISESQADAPAVGQSLAACPALRHRVAVLGVDRADLLAGLDGIAASGPGAPGAVSGTTAAGGARVALVFPGQGWQWLGMGRELLDVAPVFAETVAEISAIVEKRAGWSLLDVLTGAPGAMDVARVDVVQPLMFSVMVGLARLWESVGVVPHAVVGHSQGEIAAACVAGILSLEDAVRIVVTRSAAIVEIAGGGTMLSVAASVSVTEEALKPWQDRLWVAAVNGPSSTVVAGDIEAALEFTAAGEERELRVRRIPVDYASHSPHVEAVRERILAGLAQVVPAAGRVPMYSTVTGEVVDGTGMDSGYWYRNLREPVRFADATRALLDAGIDVFVEASAHPVLTLGIAESAEEYGADGVTVTGTLRRDDGGPARLQTSAAHIWAVGVDLDWRSLLPTGDAPVQLPSDEGAKSATAGTVDPEQDRFWRIVEREDSEELAELLGLAGTAEHALVGDALPVLSQWWRGRRERAAVSDWRYGITWKPLAVSAVPELSGTWLVLAPARHAHEEQVSSCLRAIDDHGGRAVLVTVADDAAGLTEALMDQADDSLAGIVSLLALDETPHPDHPAVPTGLATT